VNVKPKRNQVVARTVDVIRTKGGLELPASQNNATVFALIESVGDDVADPDYIPGALVVPHHFNHIYVRGGFHRIVFSDTEILGVVEDVEQSQLSVDGAPASSNGQREVGGVAV